VSPSVLRAAGPAAGPAVASHDPASAPRRFSPGAAPAGEFEWPVDGARLVRRFDPPPQPWLPGHRGADLAAPAGTAVRAAGAGSIVFAGRIAGRGVVSVAHPGGLRTTYEPVLVEDHRLGDRVTAGEPIGTLVPGHPGCPAAACLHWGLRRGGDYLDPLTLLGLGRVRLLPL
jgi:murein DD-endopeptidase MepM/ murein hydrolase activator NlpD